MLFHSYELNFENYIMVFTAETFKLSLSRIGQLYLNQITITGEHDLSMGLSLSDYVCRSVSSFMCQGPLPP